MVKTPEQQIKEALGKIKKPKRVSFWRGITALFLVTIWFFIILFIVIRFIRWSWNL